MTSKKIFIIMIGLVFAFSCKKEDKSINIFSVNKDMELGAQVATEIESNPQEYPLLNEAEYSDAYAHLNRIRGALLESDDLIYADRFVWQMKIIHNDEVINAFATPGGYIYFYTGLIKILNNEAEFAGVMAHEMAHSDRRHTTDQLTKIYGVNVLLSVLLGNDPSVIAEIAANLAAGISSLAFSRDAEYEADEYAVKYTYSTEYDARALSDFFVVLEEYPHPPEFMSTHPSPENRHEKILEHWQNMGGAEGEYHPDRYQDFKNSLP